MNQPNELIEIVNSETGDRVQTTRKVLDTYYGHQGYVEADDHAEEVPRGPFLVVSPPKIASTRQPALRGAAKLAAEKKAAK